MHEVVCLYEWSEKKGATFSSWLKADDNRFVVFVDERPFLSLPHPRMRSVFPTDDHFKSLAQEFLYSPFSFQPENHPVMQMFKKVQTEIALQTADFADQGIQLLRNLKYHLSHSTYLAKDLYGKFQDVPALVCGGGPSLSQLQNGSGLIFGCGAGVEALLKKGITPHFAVHVDPNPLHTFTPSNIPLIYQLRTSHGVAARYSGPRFLMSGPGNFPLEHHLQEKMGLEPSLDSGWTVGTVGVALALLLGCNPIILAGMDFATSRGKVYAPGIKSVDNNPDISIKNQYGETVFTRPDWILAAEWLEKTAQAHRNKTWGCLPHRGLSIRSIPTIDHIPFSPDFSMPENFSIYQGGGWCEIHTSFQKSLDMCHKLLQALEKTFPHSNGTAALLEHDLSEEMAFKHVLGPLWTFWEPVFKRQQGELFLHRILFFQSICEQACGL